MQPNSFSGADGSSHSSDTGRRGAQGGASERELAGQACEMGRTGMEQCGRAGVRGGHSSSSRR
jgi:hypothetical protein